LYFRRSHGIFILSQYSTLAWDSPDLWLDYAFTGKRKVVLEKPVAFQHSGFSLIDKEEKSGEYRIAVEEIEKEKEIEKKKKAVERAKLKRLKNKKPVKKIN